MKRSTDISVAPARLAAARAALCGLALAFPVTTFAEPPQQASPSARDPLSGPSVTDTTIPGVNRGFGGNAMDPREGAPQGRLAPGAFMRVIRSLESEDAPPERRLTEEQREKIRAVMSEYQASFAQFRAANKDRLDELLEKARPPRGVALRERRNQDNLPPGGPGADAGAPPEAPGRDDGNPPPDVREARQQLRALMEQAPKPDVYHARVFELLTPAQQAVARDRLDEARTEFDQRRAERRGRAEADLIRRRAGRAPDPDRPPPRDLDALVDRLPPEMRERVLDRLEQMTPERRARLEQRLKELSPEERRDAIQRLLERRARADQGGPRGLEGRRGRRPPPPEDRPAPGMEDVDLPPPTPPL